MYCMKQNYTTYEQALETLMLSKLSDRREKLSLKFGKNCAENPLTKDLFPKNQSEAMKTKTREKYLVAHANTARLQKSAVPYLQNLLNKNQ